jgi:hypothetical protein
LEQVSKQENQNFKARGIEKVDTAIDEKWVHKFERLLAKCNEGPGRCQLQSLSFRQNADRLRTWLFLSPEPLMATRFECAESLLMKLSTT